MFCDPRHRRLANMSETDWSDVGISELPTGTVTLLLADVEGSTRLWETQSDEMTAAIAHLDQAVSYAIAAHDGVRPVQQGEGHSLPRSGCASGCTPVRCGCATKAITSDRRSTGPRGCVIWPTAAKQCCRVRRSRWSSIGSLTGPGCPPWAPIRCAICPGPNGWCSCATATCATSSHRCAHPAPLSPIIFRRSSRVLLGAKRK